MPSNTTFITGIRGYAALGVLLIHYRDLILIKYNYLLDTAVNFGRYGVLVFFTISAFTLSISIDKNHFFLYRHYLIKRFLRIAPLYYLILFIAYITGGNYFYQHEFNIQNNLYSLLLHLSFLNWIDFRHQNNLIGVEWSIPVEFFYYLIFPFMLKVAKNNNALFFIFLTASFILSIKGYILYEHYNISVQAFYWSIPKYLFSFLAGIGTYFIFQNPVIFISTKHPDLILSLTIILFLLCVLISYSDHYNEVVAIFFTCLIILVCKKKSSLKKILFENGIILFIGNISFSIYLTHMLVKTLITRQSVPNSNPFFALTLTIIASTLTYYLVEKPFIALGNKHSN